MYLLATHCEVSTKQEIMKCTHSQWLQIVSFYQPHLYVMPNTHPVYAYNIKRSGARFARPTPCLVTIVDDKGFAICIKLTAKVPNVHAPAKHMTESIS